MSLPPWSVPAALGLSCAALVAWNLAVGARIAASASAGRAFRTLSGLAAFLLVPALLIGVLAPTAPGARVLTPLAGLWPLVTVGVFAQSLWALAIRRVAPPLGVPVSLFNGLVAWIALTRWIESLGTGLPAWLIAPGATVSSIGAAVLGDSAFLWSAWLLIPVLAPAFPARAWLGGAWRAALAAGCATLVGLTVVALPPVLDALRSGPSADAAPLNLLGRRGLSIGVGLFGNISSAPAPQVTRGDVALADSLGVSAVHLAILPAGATPGVLDSLARSIEGRREAVTLIVTLPFTAGDDEARAKNPSRWMAERTALVDRVVRRLRPDVLVPAGGTIARGSAAWWKGYYQGVAQSARRVHRDVTIAVSVTAPTALDSVLCDWVGEGDAPADAVALFAAPGRGQPAYYEAALAAVARWESLARVAPPVWLVGVPAAPAVNGELAQQRLVRATLRWGAARPWVRGIIAGDASDVWNATGLRSASGRSRPALADVGAALRAMRDLPAAAALPPDVPAPDSTGIPTNPLVPIRP